MTNHRDDDDREFSGDLPFEVFEVSEIVRVAYGQRG